VSDSYRAISKRFKFWSIKENTEKSDALVSTSRVDIIPQHQFGQIIVALPGHRLGVSDVPRLKLSRRGAGKLILANDGINQHSGE
jgi:hypothetical protein